MNVIDRVIEWFRTASRKTESQTERNGFLSYGGEWHAVVIGLAIGTYAGINWQPALVATLLGVTFGLKSSEKLAAVLRKIGKADEASTVIGEIRREPWYCAGGTLVAFAATGIAVHGPQALVDLVFSLG